MLVRGSNPGSVSSLAAAAIFCVVVSTVVFPVAATNCSDTCLANTTSTAPDASCMYDCGDCNALNTKTNNNSGCPYYFVPTWSGVDSLSSTDEGYPMTVTTRYYNPDMAVCIPLCSLSKVPWWGWLLFSVFMLLLIGSCAWCCHSCYARRKRNLEAQRAVYEAQMAQGNPYPVAGYPYQYGQPHV